MPIGLDHRRVHCTMKIPIRKKRFRKQSGFKCWRPVSDEHGHTTSYQQHICEFCEMIATSLIWTASELEKYFVESWCETWHCKAAKQIFFLHPNIRNISVLCASKHWGNICGKIEFADPTNSSARVETVEIKSVQRFLR